MVPCERVAACIGLKGSEVWAISIADGRCGMVAVGDGCSGDATGHCTGSTGFNDVESIATAQREAGVADSGMEHVRRPAVSEDES